MSKTQATELRPVRKISWIPNQKGAWMMVLVPYLAGVAGGGFRWQHILVGVFWLSGYSLFFAAENWLKSRRSAAYRLPMRLWFLVTAMLAAVALWFCGALLPWALFFLPFVAVTAWQAIERKNRSLITRTSEVCAAGLMCAVAWDIGIREELYLPALWGSGETTTLVTSGNFAQAMIVTLLLTFYFWSTIPFVKSLVRERNSIEYLVFSLLVHILGCAVTILCWRFGMVNAWVVIFWVFLFIRAVFLTFVSRVPLRKMNVPEKKRQSAETNTTEAAGRQRESLLLEPKKLLMCVGITETFISVIYACVLLAF